MPDSNENEVPLGKKIRDLVNGALKDNRKEQIQLDLLDKAFAQITIVLPKVLDKDFKQLDRHVRNRAADDEAKANLIIITAITTAAPNEEVDSPYSPVRRIQIPVSTSFTEFTAQQIRDLPNYIKMHEMAREFDIAISVGGLVDGDEGRGGQPMVSVNAMKTYDQGADFMYPILPPRKVKFDKDSSKDFTL